MPYRHYARHKKSQEIASAECVIGISVNVARSTDIGMAMQITFSVSAGELRFEPNAAPDRGIRWD